MGTRMSSFLGTRRQRFGIAAVLLVSTVLIVSVVSFDLSSLSDNAASADHGGDSHVATSVCDAHRLKAMKEDDPHLEIEIPKEFDKKFPTKKACDSHDAAWEVEAPGPMQPIPFSHKHHAGEFKIDCQYCHS